MKVGLQTGRHEPDIHEINNFYDPATAQSIQADLALAPEIEKGILLVQEYFKRTKEVPVLFYDFAGHGPIGFVFGTSSCQRDSANIWNSNVWQRYSARISFGPQNSAGNNNECQLIPPWNPAVLERLHISAYGARRFFIEEQPEPVLEEVHVSLRWIDNNFNDWSNIEKWKADRAPGKGLSLESKCFDSGRTTYMKSDKSQIYVPTDEINTRPPSPQELANLKDTRGTKKCLLPAQTPTLNELLAQESDLNMKKALEDSWPRKYQGEIHLPIIGYAPALKVLSQFGDLATPENKPVTELSPAAGVEYLFGKVLPAVKKFSET
ncbi:MAG: hypothetical protein Q7K43_02115 [Candidatus Woesearchaeota archaeon]|nr:hypothetical protein [Candidatus Woesearchaeota archaeon]